MTPARDIGRLIDIVVALRNPASGCLWDAAQTHSTLARYALEEAYEVVDAIDRADPRDLCDELGDLLLQVIFHARVAEEAGTFAFGDVVEGITRKMIRRHPHVFGDRLTGRTERGTDVNATWEAIKARERAETSGAVRNGILAGVPLALPGLTRAVKLQERASSVGFDWIDSRMVVAKIREEIEEIERELDGTADAEAVAGEIGDLLFAVANLARHYGVDPEASVRTTNAKFERRFAYIEAQLASRGSSSDAATLAEMDQLWDAAKRAGL